MRNIGLTLVIFLTASAAADVPNQFEAGNPIVASEVNENFQSHEARLDAIETQLNTVIAESQSEVQFAGFTAPAIFGTLGLRVGRSMCPELYPDSRICSVSDLESIVDWSDFSIASPFLLVSSDQNNPCGAFASRSASGNSVGYVDVNNFVGFNTAKIEGQPHQEVNYIRSSSTSGQWISENTQVWLDYGNNYHELGYTARENQATPQIRFSSCNISIPAACCK